MLRTRVRAGPVSGIIISVVLAALLTAMGTVELFLPALTPAFGEPAPVALRVPYSAWLVRDSAGDVWTIRYEHSRIVVPRRTLQRQDDEQHRAAVKYHALRRPPSFVRVASLFVLTLFSCLVLTNYFQRFSHSRVRLLRSQVGIFGLMLLVIAVGKGVMLLTALPECWMPLAALALWVAVGFDRRTAMLVHAAASFMVASLLGLDFILLAAFVVQGITATLLFFDRKRSRQMLLAGALGGVAAAMTHTSLIVLMEGKLSPIADLAQGFGSNIVACLGGGLLSGVLGHLLQEPAEFVMGHVSRDKLLDLTDIESPLLQRMAQQAPGSWEHSRAMANLAEAAAAAIGADSLLTRVGAYYHDVGKTVQPKYFIENLAPGEGSPHDALAPEVSADAIMAHVVLGTKLLRDEGVPEPVVEFAYTHHGTQLVQYFWQRYQQQPPPDDTAVEPRLDESHFRYPGMPPMSKETAILMLVDAVEAASRTIVPPDEQRFHEMIRQVVFGKLAAGQLDDSGLSITDLRVLSARLAATLVNMYHGRIKYPWQFEVEDTASEGHTPVGLPAPPAERGDEAESDSTVEDEPSGPSGAARDSFA